MIRKQLPKLLTSIVANTGWCIDKYLTARKDHTQLRSGEIPPFIEAMYGHSVPVVSTLHAETHLHVDWRL